MNIDDDDANWVARCVARLVELDPALDPELARPIAQDMCGRQRWRALAPEDAADTVFDYGSPQPPPPV
jgi:hypothetical protein